ncbi:MAG: BON domain-containing protein [Bacteroidia bacterium]
MKTNLQLQTDVQNEIAWEPKLRNVQIGVSAKDGIVTLSGQVNHYSEKMAAESAAMRVAGVKCIAEDIEVKIPGDNTKSDTEIAEMALNTLKWNTAVPDEEIKLKVDNAWITLSGSVSWKYQSQAAQKALEMLEGVKGVTNEIEIRPNADANDVQSKITYALERNALIEAKNITVESKDGEVILSGSLDSWAEYHEAERAAWSAPGVHKVDNRIVVFDGKYIES